MAAPRILVVDADTSLAQKMGLALNGSGFEVALCSFSPSEVAATIKELPPQLVLVHAELGSPQLSTLLARLESAGQALLPIVLLCRDTSEDIFVKTLRTGVVEMLQEPFSPRLHIGRMRVLLGELPERPGQLRGRGGPNELGAFVHHVMRTRRTGGVEVGNAGEGRAYFVRGVLKSARFGQYVDQPALAAMTRLQAPWIFTEGAEGTAGVVDMGPQDGDEPFLVTMHGSRPTSTPTPFDEPTVEGVPLAPTPPPQPVPPLTTPPAPARATGPFAPPAATAASTSTSQQGLAPVDPLAATTPLLFVDDEAAVVQMLASYFSKKGHPVDTAADGVEAMQKLIARSFEVVIADLNMPRLDGWGLLRLIREDVRTREVPVALFSAQDNYREALRLLQAGAQAYFPKSLRLSALDLQVKELMEPRRRFSRLIGADGGLAFDLGALGPQWVLRALSRAGFTGQLDARDAWATWRLWFDQGRLAQASARIGASTLSGDRALAGFLLSKKAEGTLARAGAQSEEQFLRQSTEATLDRLVPWLNDEQQKAREGELAKAKSLVVHDDLYRLYVSVGPPAWLPIVRLLCELKQTPAEVITRLQVTPMEVAAVVKDLLSRGVVSLQS
ncbi:MAG: response regulator [Myxococcota bacterium]|jgi:DNA-binding response OmpR family regulator